MSARRACVLAVLAITSLSACAGTEPTVREAKLPASFDAKGAGPSAAQMDWREYFADENLNGLIATALDGNFDLRVALQRIEIVRAGIKQATGAVLPQVSLGVGAGVRKFGTYTMDGAGNATTDITPGRRVPVHYADFSIGLQASWEVDIWGKLRATRSSARAQYLATIEGTNLVVTSLVSDVAVAYFELLALDHTRDILAESVARQAQALEIMRLQKEAGRANELAVQQFRSPAREHQGVGGGGPPELPRDGEPDQPAPGARSGADHAYEGSPAPQRRGLRRRRRPSDLVRNRADIREAELQVQASKLDVEAARKAFYPSLVLTAGVGYQAFDPRYLLITPESLVYSLAGGITAPLLNRSGLDAQHDAAKATQVQAMYTYQGVVLRAFVEVANALVAVESAADVVTEKKNEKAAVSGTVDAADALFRAGKATYLDVLLAQQKTLEADLELVEALRSSEWRASGSTGRSAAAGSR